MNRQSKKAKIKAESIGKNGAFSLAAGLFLTALTLAMIAAAGKHALPALKEENDRVVYLTFDDGPSCHTEGILSVLRNKGVRATFFVTAEQPEFTRWIKTIADEGHVVGAHCFVHDMAALYASPEAFCSDLDKICGLIEEECGAPPTLYRFPGGSRNAQVSPWLRKEMLAALEGRGMTYFDWNAVSGDDTRTVYPAQTLVENVLRDAGEKPVIVPLFHDFPVASTTAEAVGILIDRLRSEGYRFDVLTPEVVVRFP